MDQPYSPPRRWLSPLWWTAAALCFHAIPISALGAELRWTSTEAQPWSALGDRLQVVGWNCTEVLSLPDARQRLAACRHKPPAPAGELKLLLLKGAEGKKLQVQEVARFADASRATMRLFTPAEPCDGKPSSKCLRAIVLVDQSDESSCYGTQVFVSTTSRPLRSLGYIDEVNIDGGSERCIGLLAAVSGSPERAQIELPGPLARIGRDGRHKALKPDAIRYLISAAQPSLRRVGSGR